MRGPDGATSFVFCYGNIFSLMDPCVFLSSPCQQPLEVIKDVFLTFTRSCVAVPRPFQTPTTILSPLNLTCVSDEPKGFT